MSRSTLMLEVATPSGLKLRAEVQSVSAPSVHGEFGVLPDHLPLLAALRCGLLKYSVDGKPHVAAVGPGFVEAEPDRVEVLTDLFATPADVNVEATKEELVEADKALRAFPELHEGPDHAELLRDVEWAQAKLEAKEEAERF